MDKNNSFANIEQQVIKSLTDLSEDAKNFASKCKPDMSEKDKEKLFAERHAKFALPVNRPVDRHKVAKILYRSRLANGFKQNETITNPQAFSFIPDELVSDTFPRRSRMNLTGESVMYVSPSLRTNLREISRDIQPDQIAFMACFRKKACNKLNCYIVDPIFDISDPEKAPLYSETIEAMTNLFLDIDCDYLASSFFAHYILYVQKHFNYDAIIYPSVRAKQNGELDSNIVIKPEYFEVNYMLDWVIMGHIDSSLTTVSFKYLGLPDGNKLHWYEFKFYPDDFVVFDYFGKDGKKYSVKKTCTESFFKETFYKPFMSKINCEPHTIAGLKGIEKTLMFKKVENIRKELLLNGTSLYVGFVEISCQCVIRLEEIENPDKVLLGH